MKGYADHLPEYADHIEALRLDDPDLAAQVGDFNSVSSILNWLQEQGLCQTSMDMVGQDEFEYDWLIPVAPGGRWLVFGVT